MHNHLHPRPDRVVLVYSGGKPKGSGYLVDSRHVLTAAHVVHEVERVEVRICKEKITRPAAVLWRGQNDAGGSMTDVAVLGLDAAIDGDRGTDPTWASCGSSDLECEAIGYPKFQDEERLDGTRDKDVDTERFVGRLEPYAGLEHGRINAKHVDGSRRDEEWKGFSGAALFVDDRLVGVVTHAHTDRLLAWPVARLVTDMTFVEVVGQRALVTDELWHREDQQLLDVLRPWKKRELRDVRPSELLDASHEVVPFEEQGREEALKLLEQFMRSQDRDGALVIVGQGGVGKTRLMLEWCRRMRNDITQPWLAGFLEPGIDQRLARIIVSGRAPRLTVVDYVETDPKGVSFLLNAMASRRAGPKMRVILLARESGPWLRYVEQETDAVADLMRKYRVHELAELYTTDEARARGLERARKSFFSVGLGATSITSGQELAPGSRLTREREVAERALYVHMQALLIVQGESETTVGTLSPTDVLERVLAHERKFWRKTTEKLHGGRMTDLLGWDFDRAAAAVVMCGGVTDSETALALLEQAAPMLTADGRRNVVECFAEIYPGRGLGSIVPIEPDLLGETLLENVLARESEQKGALDRWLGLPFGEKVPMGAITRALTVLVRLSNRGSGRDWLERLLREHGVALVERVVKTANATVLDPPGTVLAEAVRHIKDIRVTEAIAQAVPESTVECLEVAAAAHQLLLEAEQAKERPDPIRLAKLLQRHGSAQSDLGRHEDALRAMQEAVETYSALAENQPRVFLPSFAGALLGLGAVYHKMGYREHAMQATQMATEMIRLLTEQGLTVFLPALASALNNLSTMYRELGKREEALRTIQEASSIHRTLAEQNPQEFQAALANSLTNLGANLSALGKSTEALLITQEAIEIYRVLSEQNADGFLPDLAMTLINLGAQFSKLGQLEDALHATAEAVDIRRALAKRRPDTFLPMLSSALTNLGKVQSELGMREEALSATQEAIGFWRDLVERNPRAFMPDLASPSPA